MIHGIDVILYDRSDTGLDGFGKPVYEEAAILIPNVVVAPIESSDVIESTQLDGKTQVYELYIPKGDDHIWENRRVEFWGQTWETVGSPLEYIEDNVPLGWNRKVRVKRFE